MNRINRLYPQYQISEDRRKNNIPVAIDRRSGKDRRAEDRVALDSRLTRDIYQVKGQIAKLENITPKLFEKHAAFQSTMNADKSNLAKDRFIKSIKPDTNEILRQEARLRKKADTSFKIGVLSAALAGTLAVSFMGTVGTVMAVGLVIYIGARVFKSVLETELREFDETDY